MMTYTRTPWETFEDTVAGGYSKAVAHRLKVSYQLVRAWCQEPRIYGGDGEHNPFERVVETVRALRDAGCPRSEDLVRWINEETGYLPPIRLGEERISTINEISVFLKESAEFLAAVADGSEDGAFDRAELERIDKELGDVMVICGEIKAAVRAEILEQTKNVARTAGRSFRVMHR